MLKPIQIGDFLIPRDQARFSWTESLAAESHQNLHGLLKFPAFQSLLQTFFDALLQNRLKGYRISHGTNPSQQQLCFLTCISKPHQYIGCSPKFFGFLDGRLAVDPVDELLHKPRDFNKYLVVTSNGFDNPLSLPPNSSQLQLANAINSLKQSGRFDRQGGADVAVGRPAEADARRGDDVGLVE
jgi:hypothetical protein